MDKLQKVVEKFALNVLTIDYVRQSFSSVVYKIKLIDFRTVYIKIPYSKVKLEHEYKVLERLRYELSVPQVLDYWEGDEGFTGALLLSAIQGMPATGKVDAALAFDIGIQHAKLHAIIPKEQDFENFISNMHGQSSDFIQHNFYSLAKDVKEVIDPHLYEQSMQHFEYHLKLIPYSDATSFIHLDFRPGNILVYENQISGIIDFESFSIGATEMDFTKINRYIFMEYPGTKEAYRQGYESIRPLVDLQEILPFYQFIDLFNAIGWCKRRGIENYQTFLQKNIANLNAFFTNVR
ncbi:phosphotransferase [Bacillus sp. L_1B0_8]|uniref:phosphotransferase family protein n=1 Tax=unclassified Bacillus (in: firmicutes) TaxID=185979 RepID=UPI0005B745ED|nr:MULTISPECIES: aminoglycoside phosphotransferase family protein [unclassified Bacillus (in: firmicutes)]KIQ77061.1 phosphotransferase [Bacillus sp. L_1B0_5]KIQ78207.1 phosphotransferase [Bacillus sp. L_1B0_8]